MMVAITSALAACNDVDQTAPRVGSPEQAGRQILDAAHGGTPHFYFLPPMVAAPKHNGTFDPSLSPTVEICALAGDVCAPPLVASFSMTGGIGGAVVLNTTDQTYGANWNTGATPLDVTKVYRITVKVVTTELGHCDVRLVNNGSQAKNASTGDDIVLVDGRTLPIKFRVEQGAVAVIGAAGGTARLDDGAVTLVFPPGALNGDAGVTATPVAPGGIAVVDASVISGTRYEFQPSPTTFAAPVTLTLTYPSALPAGVKASRLVICKKAGDACVPIPRSVVDASTRRVSGEVSSFSEYALTTSIDMLYAVGTDADARYWLHTGSGELGPFPSAVRVGDLGTDEGLRDEPSWSPDGARITYVTGPPHPSGYGSTLRVMNADLTGDHELITPDDPIRLLQIPSWSRDGSKILVCRVQSLEEGGWGPATVNTDGTNLFAYFRGGDNCGHSISPDGRFVAVVGQNGIDIVNVEGTNSRHVLDCNCYYGMGGYFPQVISWSADGTQLAIFGDWSGSSSGHPDANGEWGPGVYLINVDGSNLRPLRRGIIDAQWSPIPGDNRLVFTQGGSLSNDPYYGTCDIYFSCGDLLPRGIYIVNADGSGTRLLVSRPEGESLPQKPTPHRPRWSPDGQRISFEWASAGGFRPETWVINTDGSGLQLAVPSVPGAHHGIWRP
jgi:Tol biopolymer transport system component